VELLYIHFTLSDLHSQNNMNIQNCAGEISWLIFSVHSLLALPYQVFHSCDEKRWIGLYEKRIQSKILGFGVTRLGLFCSRQMVNGKFHPMFLENFRYQYASDVF
jgi:hypothetical protein